jgi:hypothetical protein
LRPSPLIRPFGPRPPARREGKILRRASGNRNSCGASRRKNEPADCVRPTEIARIPTPGETPRNLSPFLCASVSLWLMVSGFSPWSPCRKRFIGSRTRFCPSPFPLLPSRFT